MVEYLQVTLPLIIYVLLIVILIVGIILGIKSIKTMTKVEKVVDDVNEKVQSLNGVFSLVDYTTDKLVSITDQLVEGVSGIFGRLFRRNKNKIRKED